jgi:hypothetical protein
MKQGRIKAWFRRKLKTLSQERWAFVDPNDATKGTWIQERVRSNGKWGVGCRLCAAASKSNGAIGDSTCTLFMNGTVRRRKALFRCQLIRHARSKFHVATLPSGSNPFAPSVEQFQKVLKFVMVHHGAAHEGLDNVGGSAKLRKMIICLAEACKRLDQRFLRDARSITLARDGRKARLSVRFVAVDSSLAVRRGVLGLACEFGTGAAAIAKATANMMEGMATTCEGARCDAL